MGFAGISTARGLVVDRRVLLERRVDQLEADLARVRKERDKLRGVCKTRRWAEKRAEALGRDDVVAKSLVRALLLRFHPDRAGVETTYSSTEATQHILQVCDSVFTTTFPR